MRLIYSETVKTYKNRNEVILLIKYHNDTKYAAFAK